MAPRSRTRTCVFSLVAIGGLLLVVELLLALAGVVPLAARQDPFRGFSQRVRVYEADTARGVRRTPVRAVRHSFNYQEFDLQKADDDLRIFVLGGSSAYGFPWGAGQAFPAALERALQDALPQRNVQAINAAAMSYGSHRLRLLTHEILDYEPDLLVIYSGHNEFVERNLYEQLNDELPLPGGLRLLLYRWRLYSALTRLLTSAAERPADGGSAGELIGLDAQRSYSTDVAAADRDEVRAQFETNLRAIVAAAQARGVAVLLCTVPSNERGWRPNQTTWPGNLGVAERSAAVAAIERAAAANDAGEPAAALAALAATESLSATAAGAWFERARALLALERTAEAARAFTAARDLDGQPGRALTRINETIRHVAQESGVLFVDTEAAFRGAAGDGIPGFDLFEDYVHPKPGAHLLIARELWRTLLASDLFGDPAALPDERFLAALGLDPAFDFLADSAMPQAEQTAGSAPLLFNLAVVLENQGRNAEAMERYRRCLELDAGYFVARVNLARLLRLGGRAEEAAVEYAAVLLEQPGHLNSAIGLGESLRMLGRLTGATAAYRRATEIDATAPGAWNGLGAVYTLAADHVAAEDAFRRTLELDAGNLLVRGNLAMAIFFQGRLADAETEFRAILAVRPDDPGALSGLGAIAIERDELDAAADWFERVLALDPDNSVATSGLAEIRRRSER